MTTRSIAQSVGAALPGHARVAGTSQRLRVSSTNLVLLSAGSLFHLLAEASLFPLVAALVYYYAGWVALLLPKLGGDWERRIYTRVFLAGFLAAGVSALYRTLAGDLQGDASHFFELASSAAAGWSLVEIAAVTEGAFAVVLWRGVFDFMTLLGFPREQYVGVLINVLVVALSGVVALRMARLVYGDDVYRYKRMILLFSACGLFWIFSGILVRDSVVLLGVSLLAYAWLCFLIKPDLSFRFYFIIASSLLAGVYFGFIRTEFVFVPIAMAIAAVAALLVGHKEGRGRTIAYLLVFIGLIVTGWLLANFGEALQLALTRGQEDYFEQASSQHGDSSLGMALIVNQPMPIRLPLGAIYLFVFPIPFWSGFQFESVYQLFKAFNVIYFYLVIPLLILAFRQIWKDKSVRSPVILFLLFLVVGFTLAVAGSSLETRHLGAFFVPVFILALLPDMRFNTVRHNYRQLLYTFLGSVLIVHYLWLVIKVGFFILPIPLLVILLMLSNVAASKKARYIYLALFFLLLGYMFV